MYGRLEQGKSSWMKAALEVSLDPRGNRLVSPDSCNCMDQLTLAVHIEIAGVPAHDSSFLHGIFE